MSILIEAFGRPLPALQVAILAACRTLPSGRA